MISPEQLKALRHRLQWDQAETAAVLHVSQRQYQRYERGTPLPYAVGALFVLLASAVLQRAEAIRKDAHAVAVARGLVREGEPITVGACLLVYPVDLQAFPLQLDQLPFALGELADRCVSSQEI